MTRWTIRLLGNNQLQLQAITAAFVAAAGCFAIVIIGTYVWEWGYWAGIFGGAAFVAWLILGIRRSGNYEHMRDMKLDVGYVQEVGAPRSA